MKSIVPRTRTPYMNLLQAVGDTDGALESVTLGPCTGDDEMIVAASSTLGPSVGDDTDTFRTDSLGPSVGDDTLPT